MTATTAGPPGETVRYWRPESLPGVEILHEYGSARPCAYFFEAYTLAAALEIDAVARYRRRTYALASGAVHLGEPGELYATLCQRRPCSIQVVRLDPAMVEAFARDLGLVGTTHFRATHAADGDAYRALLLFHRTLSDGSGPLEQETRLGDALRLILARYAECSPQLGSPDLPKAALDRARDYLHAHWDEAVTLGDLAQAADLSRSYLADSFRRAFGLPPHAYLTQLRLARAQRLLARGDAPARVAAATGFADQAHLTRHFRRALGITPGAYARNRTIVQDSRRAVPQSVLARPRWLGTIVTTDDSTPGGNP